MLTFLTDNERRRDFSLVYRRQDAADVDIQSCLLDNEEKLWLWTWKQHAVNT